jgi:hypothetical protein
MLLFPSFWGNAFFLAIKEHWIYLIVFSLIFNCSSLMRGEFLEFIISSTFVAAVLFFLYVTFIFILKVFKEPEFRLLVNTQPCVIVVSGLLGIKNEVPQIIKCNSLNDDLPDATSKIGFTLMMVVSIATIVGILYIWFLIANR